jgi:succinyl-diaminopimelate desuccinylase
LHLEDPIALAMQLMKEPSVTPDAAGCFDLLEQWLGALGFKVWREVFHEEGFAPTENLYARLGDSAPNLCFAGHVDVVSAGDMAAWTHPPFEPVIHDGVLYGRGAEDMKGAIASMVAAVAQLIQSRAWTPAQGSLSFLLTADEEGIAINGTPKMLTWLKERGETLDFCMVGEPTNPNQLGDMCKIGRRGSLLCKLEVQGVQGHVAYPERADNPITALVAMLHRLKTTQLDTGNAYFQPSNLEITTIDVGNLSENMIPATARAEFNIRFTNHYNGESLIEWVRAQCNAVGHAYTLKTRISGESFFTGEGVLSEALVTAVEKVTGKTPELSTTGGTSDARFIKDFCPVIEFGTTGHTPHKVNECVQLDVLIGLRDVYREFVVELFTSR